MSHNGWFCPCGCPLTSTSTTCFRTPLNLAHWHLVTVVASKPAFVWTFDPWHTRAGHSIHYTPKENMSGSLKLPPPAPKLASFAVIAAASLQFRGRVLESSFDGDRVQHSHGQVEYCLVVKEILPCQLPQHRCNNHRHQREREYPLTSSFVCFARMAL